MSGDKLKRIQADQIQFRAEKKRVEQRRATSPAQMSEEHEESAARRKTTVGSTNHRVLFQRTSRTSWDDILGAESFTSTKVDRPVKLQMGERELGQKPITIMSVLRLSAEKYPERQAYAYKLLDTWQYITYKELDEHVRRAAKGFISFGLERYSGVAIIGRNAPEAAIANFAAIYAGGIAVPISTALSLDEYSTMVKNTQCSIIVIGSSKQLDIIEHLRNQLIYINAVIKYGKDGGGTSVRSHTWEKLLAMGEKVDDERLKERIEAQAPNLCCTIMHTPGTSGPAKPVMLSHDNLIWTSRTIGRRMSCSHGSGVVVSMMSQCHVGGLIFNLYVPLLFSSTVYFMATPNVLEWTKEAHPTSLYAPYLVFEELRLQMTAQLKRSCWSRLVYCWANSIGLKGYRAITRRRPLPCCWSMANALVYQKIRIRLGLENSREFFIGGRTQTLQALEFFAGLNFPLLEIYGMTECAGPITVAAIPDMYRITSVGKEIDGCTAKICEPDKTGMGDIRLRGRNVFMGYLNEPELTNAAFDKDGWFITGDLASRDENGFIYMNGKIAELVTLENGEAISPELIEARVREALPFIRNCMLVGKGRAYLTVLLTIKTVVDWETFEVSNTFTPDARKLFQKMGYKDDNIDRFLKDPDKRIVKRIQASINRLNAKSLPSHRIQNWTILPRDFTVQSGELNYTVRFRRFLIEEKYAETINSMYAAKTTK